MSEYARTGPRARELALCALVLALLLLVMLGLSGGAVLFTRPLWVDEWFTVLVASRSSPVDVVADLARGADGGASLLHLAVWGVGAVTGALTPEILRALSVACVLGALCLVYAVLRRRFTPAASAGGMLAVGSHALVVAHAFEARFYAPWLLCCAVFAWSLSRAAEALSSRQRNALVALAAILLCTVHWYGFISLGLMVLGAVAGQGRRWRDGLHLVAPSAVGILALLAIAPLAVGQSGAITVASWVPDFSAGQLTGLARALWLAPVPVAAAAAVLLAKLFRRTTGAAPAHGTGAHIVREPGNAALLALTVMPIALAILSLLGQPSMLGRYAIPATLAWAPWVAGALERLSPWTRRIAMAALAMLWFGRLTREAGKQQTFALDVGRHAAVLRRAQSMGMPVVFTSMHTMYPLVAAGRERDTNVVFLELGDSALATLVSPTTRFYQLNKGITLERDFARVHAARFGFPRLAPQAALDTTARFLLLSTEARLPRGMQGVTEMAETVFPRHRATRLAESLWLLEHAAGRSLPVKSTFR